MSDDDEVFNLEAVGTWILLQNIIQKTDITTFTRLRQTNRSIHSFIESRRFKFAVANVCDSIAFDETTSVLIRKANYRELKKLQFNELKELTGAKPRILYFNGIPGGNNESALLVINALRASHIRETVVYFDSVPEAIAKKLLSILRPNSVTVISKNPYSEQFFTEGSIQGLYIVEAQIPNKIDNLSILLLHLNKLVLREVEGWWIFSHLRTFFQNWTNSNSRLESLDIRFKTDQTVDDYLDRILLDVPYRVLWSYDNHQTSVYRNIPIDNFQPTTSRVVVLPLKSKQGGYMLLEKRRIYLGVFSAEDPTFPLTFIASTLGTCVGASELPDREEWIQFLERN